MKITSIISYVTLATLTGQALAQQESTVDSAAVQSVGILPKQRKSIVIGDKERNPFGEPPGSKKVVSAEAETEEMKIRTIFKNLNVTGVRRDSDGELVAVAEDLFFKVGEKVKPVLAGQFEQLSVSNVTSDQVEIAFLETKEATQPRKITMPIVTAATVKEKLYGRKASGSTGQDFYVVGVKGVIMPTKPSEEAETAPIIETISTPNIIKVDPSIESSSPATNSNTNNPVTSPKSVNKSVIE
jgi:hypothetical protein